MCGDPAVQSPGRPSTQQALGLPYFMEEELPLKVPFCPLLGSKVGRGDFPTADKGSFDMLAV